MNDNDEETDPELLKAVKKELKKKLPPRRERYFPHISNPNIIIDLKL